MWTTISQQTVVGTALYLTVLIVTGCLIDSADGASDENYAKVQCSFAKNLCGWTTAHDEPTWRRMTECTEEKGAWFWKSCKTEIQYLGLKMDELQSGANATLLSAKLPPKADDTSCRLQFRYTFNCLEQAGRLSVERRGNLTGPRVLWNVTERPGDGQRPRRARVDVLCDGDAYQIAIVGTKLADIECQNFVLDDLKLVVFKTSTSVSVETVTMTSLVSSVPRRVSPTISSSSSNSRGDSSVTDYPPITNALPETDTSDEHRGSTTGDGTPVSRGAKQAHGGQILGTAPMAGIISAFAVVVIVVSVVVVVVLRRRCGDERNADKIPVSNAAGSHNGAVDTSRERGSPGDGTPGNWSTQHDRGSNPDPDAFYSTADDGNTAGFQGADSYQLQTVTRQNGAAADSAGEDEEDSEYNRLNLAATKAPASPSDLYDHTRPLAVPDEYAVPHAKRRAPRDAAPDNVEDEYKRLDLGPAAKTAPVSQPPPAVDLYDHARAPEDQFPACRSDQRAARLEAGGAAAATSAAGDGDQYNQLDLGRVRRAPPADDLYDHTQTARGDEAGDLYANVDAKGKPKRR